MLPDSTPPGDSLTSTAGTSRLLAPLWHTAVVLFILIGGSLGGSRGVHPLAGHSKLPQYLWTMAWEWILVGLVYLGIRKRIKLSELIGDRWANIEDFLHDLLIAAGFWLVAAAVLGAGAKLLRLDDGSKFDTLRR